MNISVPLVIYHIQRSPLYFQKVIEYSAKFNHIILIGDETNTNLFHHLPNVKHVSYQTLISPESVEFEQYFVNYSTNSAWFELQCFQRVFLLRELMRQHGYDRVFHADSDCITMVNAGDFLATYPQVQCALVCPKQPNPFHMACSIHNSIINTAFCDAFVQLCKDIYQNKSKFYLIEPKIRWHQENNLSGGICDMTLYYLIYEHRLVNDIINLMGPILYQGDVCVFDTHMIISEGYDGEKTFQMETNPEIKRVVQIQGVKQKCYFVSMEGKLIRTLSLHFQGLAKQFLEQFDLSHLIVS